jgi:glycosyltransferase involved in cell wall biosynthesis
MKTAIEALIPSGGREGSMQTLLISLARAFAQHQGPEEKFCFHCSPEFAASFKSSIDNLHEVLVQPTPAPSFFERLKRSLRPLRAPAGRIVRGLRQVIKGPQAAMPVTVPQSEGFIESLDADVYHVTYPYHFIRTRVPTVYTIHDLQHKHLPQYFSEQSLRFRETVYQAAFDESRYVIAVSHFTRRDVIRHHGVAPEKIFTIHWAPPTRLIREQPPEAFAAVAKKLRLPSDYIIFPSLTYGHKNHVTLLDALQLLRRRSGLRIFLVCPGYRSLAWPTIRSRVKELGLEEQVCFPGYIPETDLLGLLRGARFMVFPSLFEGAGLPALEAISEGIPLACSDIPAFREYIGPAALYFDPASPESVADALLNMHSSPDLLAQLRIIGPQQAARFTWEKTARAHRALYRKAAGLEISAEDQKLLRQCQEDEQLAFDKENRVCQCV